MRAETHRLSSCGRYMSTTNQHDWHLRSALHPSGRRESGRTAYPTARDETADDMAFPSESVDATSTEPASATIPTRWKSVPLACAAETSA